MGKRTILMGGGVVTIVAAAVYVLILTGFDIHSPPTVGGYRTPDFNTTGISNMSLNEAQHNVTLDTNDSGYLTSKTRYFKATPISLTGVEVNNTVFYPEGLNGNGTLKMGREQYTVYDAGFVFNVTGTVTQGDTVKYARLKFVSWGNVTQSSIMLNITGADADSISGFNSTQRPSMFTRTGNYSSWTPAETWELNDSYVYFNYYSPDISGVVNEILSRPSWNNETLGIFVDDINTDTSSNNTLLANLSATGLELYTTVKDTFNQREYLSRPTNTSITISLFSVMDTESYVEYGTSPGTYTMTTPVLTVAEDEPIEHVLTGLQPDTAYFYRVRARKAGTADTYEAFDEYNFTTARNPGRPFTFDVVTDSHLMKNYINYYYGTGAGGRVLTRVNNVLNLVKNDDPDFVIDLGDFIMTHLTCTWAVQHQKSAYWRGSIARNYIENISSNISIFNSWDNHDVQLGFDIPERCYDENRRNWSDNVKLKYFPNPNSRTYRFGGGPLENYYAFEWGDALIVVIDANRYTTTKPTDPENWTIGAAQLQWLNDTLKSSSKPWKFVFAGHIVGGDGYGCPPGGQYCYGDGGAAYAYTGEQAQIQQMMVDSGAQFFIHGHSHLFSNATNNSVTYITAGTYGANPARTGKYRYDTIYANESPINKSGYLRISVNSTAVKIEFVNDSDGAILRTLTQELPSP